jgi:salicylate hydroxylase
MGTILSCLRSTYTSVFSLFGAGQERDDAGQPKTAHSVDSKSQDKPPFEIAIIGAGIGGLTFAIACLKNNVPFVLYEAAPKFSLVGAGVGFGPNALRAMEMIDPKLRSMYGDISSGNVTPNKHHVAMDVLYVEEGFGTRRGWAPAPFGAECYERTSAHRWDLLNIMTSMIPGDRVRFNKRVRTMGNVAAGVSITFEDGEVAHASAVVGTDGVKGPARSYVLAEQYPSEVKATYSGKYAYRATIPMEDALKILGSHAGDAKCFIGHNVNFMTYPISKGTQLNLVACKFVEDPWTCEQWTRTVTREEMIADFADTTDWRLVKLLDVRTPLLPGI